MLVHLLVLVLAACQRSSPRPPPPAEPAPAPTPAPTATPPASPDAATLPAPAEPPRLRLLLSPPPGNDLRGARAWVEVDGRPIGAALPVRSREDAREGAAILLVIGGGAPASLRETIRSFLRTLRAEDRIAVAVARPTGLDVPYPFSADVSAAAVVVEHLVTGHATEAVPLYRAVAEAVSAFAGRTLPPLRAVLVIADGQDGELRRASRVARRLVEVRRAAAQLGVRILTAGAGNDATALGRLRELAEGSGGAFAPVAAPLDRTLVRLLEHVTSRAIVDVPLPGVPTGRHELAVRLTRGAEEKRVAGVVDVRPPAGEPVPVDLELPAAPDALLPPGITPERDLEGEARTAERDGRLLLAGALWHLAHDRTPTSRNAWTRARALDDQSRRGTLPPAGLLQISGREAPVDVHVDWDEGALARAWEALTGAPAGLEAIVWDREETAPGVRQVVLHRCEVPTAERCLPALLAQGTATHLFVAADGHVTQLVDLIRVVSQPDVTLPAVALSVTLALPPDRALAAQDPADPQTFRQVRRFVEGVDVNDEERPGFDLTDAQYASLVPLLAAIGRQLPDVKPVLPIDLSRHATLHALLHPEAFQGVLLHSNLSRTVGRCPGPGLRVADLNDMLPRWSLPGAVLDAESWLDDLGVAAREDAAVWRFGQVGALGVPFLLESAAESPAPEARGAMRALAAIGDSRAAPTLAGRLAAWPPEPAQRDATAALLATALDGLARLGTAAEVPALAGFVAKLDREPTADRTALDLRRRAVSAMAAAIDSPAELGPLARFLTGPDAHLRAVAAAAYLRVGGLEARDALRRLLSDPEPWVRVLAARAMGPAGVGVVAAARDGVGIPVAAAALGSLSPERPAGDTLGWWDEADAAGRLALAELWARWQWPEAVRALAPRLTVLRGMDRALVLHALRRVTGRDLGSDPAGWLAWRPERRQPVP